MPEQKNNLKRGSFLKVFFFKYHNLVTTLTILILIVGSYYLILQPKYREVSIGGRYNLSSLQQDLENRNEYLKKLQELNDSYKNLSSSQLTRLEQALPKESDIPGLLVQLESLAFSEGVFLRGVSFSEVPQETLSTRSSNRTVRNNQTGASSPDQLVRKISVNLDLLSAGAGNYEQIKSFLAALENNLRIFDIDSVFFDPNQTVFSVNLVTYYLN